MAIYNVSITLPDGELDTITVEAPTAGAAQAEARSLAGLGSRIGRATEAERESFTLLHRLVFNCKRIMSKIPFVRSQLGTYAAALFLLKEHYKIENLPEGEINQFLMENKLVSFDNKISEEVIGFGSMLPMGEYKLKDQVTADDEEIDAQPGDIVSALEDTPPSDRILGVDVFPVIHKKSNKIIYVSLEDIND